MNKEKLREVFGNNFVGLGFYSFEGKEEQGKKGFGLGLHQQQ